MRTLPTVALAGLSVLLCLSACETTLEVELPSREPKLVVNALFNPDSLWEVRVSRSNDLNEIGLTYIEPRLFEVEDATVEIWENNILLTKLVHNSTLYVKDIYQSGHLRPELEKTYTLKVSAPGFESIEAQSRIPSPVQIIEYSRTDSVGLVLDEYVWPYGELRLRFYDPPEEANYYLIHSQLNIFGSWPGFDAPFGVNAELENVFLYDFIEDIGDGDIDVLNKLPISGRFVFDDRLFNGQEYELIIRFPYFSPNEPIQYPIQFVVAVITEEMFQYLRTHQRQLAVRDNPFAEPVQIFSNVRNGMGIFAGYTILLSEIIP